MDYTHATYDTNGKQIIIKEESDLPAGPERDQALRRNRRLIDLYYQTMREDKQEGLDYQI